METKIVLLLAVVALSMGCCEGLGNIHGDRYKRIHTKEQLDKFLTDEFAPNPREVARLLIHADYKFQTLKASKGIQIDQLLDMTMPNYYCRVGNFEEYQEWLKLFSGPNGNVYLMNYVKENIDRLLKLCAEDVNNAMEKAVAESRPSYMRLISDYVEKEGKEKASQEKIVRGFLKTDELSDKELREVIKDCATMVPHVKASLFFFLKDNEKVSDYLNNLGDNLEEALVYKRCKVINEMFGKQ